MAAIEVKLSWGMAAAAGRAATSCAGGGKDAMDAPEKRIDIAAGKRDAITGAWVGVADAGVGAGVGA